MPLYEYRCNNCMSLIQVTRSYNERETDIICPKCDHKIPHARGIPCQEERCPVCGAKMLREGPYHHRLLMEKRQRRGDP